MKAYNLAFKYSIYSNAAQTNTINQTFACTRLVYNTFLGQKKQLYRIKKSKTFKARFN